jgi:glucose/mannose-6-phosphate isomerase
MIDLDNVAAIRAADPDDMLARIRDLGDQCRTAWQNAAGLRLPDDYRRNTTAMLVLGMGGSAIGGDLMRSLASQHSPHPILVNRGYEVPAWVGPRTLVVASSHSGNTEETLAAAEAAHTRGARLVAITTGGELARRARAWGIPLLTYQYAAQPRAVIGHSLVNMVALAEQLGWLPPMGPAVAEAAAVVEAIRSELDVDVPAERNPAKQLAGALAGRLPVIYGAGLLEEVARRWKGQLNENSKAWAFFEALPEANHNGIVGYEHPAALSRLVTVIFLQAAADHPRVQIRQRVTKAVLDQRGVRHATIEARGASPLAQVLSVLTTGDWVSYYLALLNGADPTPVAAIDYLKAELART